MIVNRNLLKKEWNKYSKEVVFEHRLMIKLSKTRINEKRMNK